MRILQTSAGVTTRMASVSPERRPARKVTWGGMDDDAIAVEEEDGARNRLYHPPMTSR